MGLGLFHGTDTNIQPILQTRCLHENNLLRIFSLHVNSLNMPWVNVIWHRNMDKWILLPKVFFSIISYTGKNSHEAPLSLICGAKERDLPPIPSPHSWILNLNLSGPDTVQPQPVKKHQPATRSRSLMMQKRMWMTVVTATIKELDYTKQVMSNAIPPHFPTNAQTVPKPWSLDSFQSS